MLNKEVFDYFLDLNKTNLNKENGIFIRDKSFETLIEDRPELIKILDKEIFAKLTPDLTYNLAPIIFSKMYNKCGVLSPPIFICKNNSNEIFQLTENVKKLTDFKDCIHPDSTDCTFKNITNKSTKTINNIKNITNKDFKDAFLEIMTPECYDKLASLFIIDELRTESDRHTKNYFLYKLKNSDKFNGVIAIDSDFCEILCHGISNKSSFYEFLSKYYMSNTMDFACNYGCYKERFKNLKETILSGKLSTPIINSIKTSLNYDLPKEIKDLGESFCLPEKEINYVYTPISYLWEYNRKKLEKELDL